MLILDGKALAAEIRKRQAAEVEAARALGLRQPGLAVVLAGDDPASKVYVRNKQRACAEAGIRSVPHFLPADVGVSELLKLIGSLNADKEIDGILLQLPLPRGLETRPCLDAISPDKDVDGFHPLNMGRLCLGLPGFAPCTPAGVLAMLEHYKFQLAGRRAVVIGRSDIVGKPLAIMLASRAVNATVTLCHSATPNLADICREADFLFAAMGRPGAIGADMIKEGAVVVDIGINRTPGGLAGDVDFTAVAPKTAAITPVPGGVGPMTIAMLLRNTITAWQKHLAPAS